MLRIGSINKKRAKRSRANTELSSAVLVGMTTHENKAKKKTVACKFETIIYNTTEQPDTHKALQYTQHPVTTEYNLFYTAEALHVSNFAIHITPHTSMTETTQNSN